MSLRTPQNLSSRASTITRRHLLKSTLTIGVAAVASPVIIRNAYSSSGELTFEGWAGYDSLKSTVLPAFEKATGIKVKFKEAENQDVMLTDARAINGRGDVDVMEATANLLSAWIQNDVVQGWDTKKLAMDRYLPGVPGGTAGDLGEIKGTRYFVPSVWGTEALTFDPKQVDGTYGKLGLADLFDDRWTAKVTLRGHSALAAMGRVLDAQGKLPMPFLEGYKSEDNMRKIWDVCLAEAIKHKKNIVQFWNGENEAQSAFKNNGAALGLTWDSTGYSLKKDGFGFVAPKEGAFAWSQGFVLLKGAKNAEQAHEFAKWVSSPEGAGAWASAFYANPVAKGGAEHMAPDVPEFYAAAFPQEAMQKLWWWPAFSTWYLKLRGEYATKFTAG